MSFTPKKKSNYPPIPAGTQHAICYSIVDLGTQKTTYKGEESWKQQIVFTFEFPNLRIDVEREDGTKENLPRVTSRTYTLSFHKKSNLAIDYLSWAGKAIKSAVDITGRLGANCLLTMTQTEPNDEGTVYSNIASISGLMPEMVAKRPENPMVAYQLEQGEPPESVPEWLRNKIKQSLEHTAVKNAQGSEKLAAAQAAFGGDQGLPCNYLGEQPTPGDVQAIDPDSIPFSPAQSESGPISGFDPKWDGAI